TLAECFPLTRRACGILSRRAPAAFPDLSTVRCDDCRIRTGSQNGRQAWLRWRRNRISFQKKLSALFNVATSEVLRTDDDVVKTPGEGASHVQAFARLFLRSEPQDRIGKIFPIIILRIAEGPDAGR